MCQTETTNTAAFLKLAGVKIFRPYRWSRQILNKCHPTPICWWHISHIKLLLFQLACLQYRVPSLTNTLSAGWVSLSVCQAVSPCLFAFSLSATHLGLVIHDSWSMVSKFNLRCDKTAHIYKFCAECLPIWIVLTSFFCQTCAAHQTHNAQAVYTTGISTNRLNGDKSEKAVTKNLVVTLQVENVKY